MRSCATSKVRLMSCARPRRNGPFLTAFEPFLFLLFGITGILFVGQRPMLANSRLNVACVCNGHLLCSLSCIIVSSSWFHPLGASSNICRLRRDGLQNGSLLVPLLFRRAPSLPTMCLFLCYAPPTTICEAFPLQDIAL